MKLLCKLFGHKWDDWKKRVPNASYEIRICYRCGHRERRLPTNYHKWLDKHMD
ncbi:hypothetical protein EFL44_10745 [Lactococcus cremoris]|uniref:ORF26 n=1 Tax=Lactococcus phage TP901-1C TaxID=343949 RepID=Q2QER9_9CAUD|nr:MULTISPECIES: DUF1660 domain-containing protein [Lactococcus]NP_112689.1 DUF1660 domain-containing protein [Lactococcus phage TP901-1]AAZ99223.1 ORF26 [Lactococcus phage TP901-1C]AAK38043.1 ORF26 [Lactococcus phage TP901-1]MCM6841327.1 DUF1660 domain-containing protein [Lactococcus lactis]MCM6849931.1 DUF1660 domain-containing protein [Lactococcus lactis]MCM6852353.1 DUF1660 domain-containing protein [Lactococcus lactis]